MALRRPRAAASSDSSRGRAIGAVMGGLVVATLLTLVFLPALYVAWFRIEPSSVPQLPTVDVHQVGNALRPA